MANFRIPIDFDSKKGLVIPDTFTVALGYTVEFELRDRNVQNFIRRFAKSGLKFQVYFENDSPFDWRTASSSFSYPRPQSTGGMAYQFQYGAKYQILASGLAREKGDFKYGVKVTNPDSGETLFDEDPYLIVI